MSIQVVESWLAQQCASIPGATSAVIAMPAGASGDRVVVHWPQQKKPLDALVGGLKNVLKHHRPLVQVLGRASSKQTFSSLIGAPVQLDENTFAAATFKLDGQDEVAAKASLKQLLQGLASLRQALQQEHQTQAQQDTVKHLTELLASTLDTQGFHQTALVACNELATRLHCERVSFGYRKNKATQVLAVSNTTEIKQSHELTQALSTMMDEAVDQTRLVMVNNGLGDEHINTLAHRLFSRDHGGHNLISAPLVSHGKVIGALSFEKAHHAPFKAQDRELIEQLASFLAPLLSLKHTLERPWLERTRGHLSQGFQDIRRGQRVMGKAFWITTLVTLILCSMPLAQYRVGAPAQIEGAVQRSITAPVDGFLKQALAKPGDLVGKDQVLALLEDKDLLLEQQRLGSRLAQLKGSFGSAMAKRDLGAVATGRAELEEVEAELALIDQHLARTKITAPFAGEIIDGDLLQSLGAPVRRGDVMMTLAPRDDYRIIFHVAENQINEIKTGQTGALALASQPSVKHPLTVSRVTPLANVEGGKNVFKVEGLFLRPPQDKLRPGMGGIVKIDIEKRALFWITFHSAAEWLSLKRWQWLGF